MKAKPLPVLFLTVFIDLLGFGILIPVIPQLLANPFSPYYLLTGSGLTPQQGFIIYGFLLAAFPLAQFFSTPILGQLSDRYGRKPLLIATILGGAGSYALMAIGIILHSLPLLFVSRIFQGILGGNIAIAQAIIADITAPKDRAKTFGLIGAAFGLGFILGPFLGGKLSDPSVVSWFRAETPFWFSAALCLLNALWALSVLPETLAKKETGRPLRLAQSVLNIAKAFKFPDLRVIFLTGFLFNGGFSFFTAFFAVFLISKFHWTQGHIGDFYAYVGIWIAFCQAVIMRAIGGKVSESLVVRVALIGSGTAILAYLIPDRDFILYFIAPFGSIMNGLAMANLGGLLSRSVGSANQGEVLGINASIQALAQAIPPILSGYIAASIAPSTPVWVAGITIIAGGLVFAIFYRKPKTTNSI
jgi:DHA1 family tetracycline resistance protein-like MFS transporter